MMSELSIAQKQYILSQKKHRRTVRIGRSSICILFLLLWEFTADAGIIDSFVFSSPSKIVTCFISMLKDGSILLHTGITLFETFVSFLFFIIICNLTVVQPKIIGNFRALPCNTEQSPKIRFGSSADCLAGSKL